MTKRALIYQKVQLAQELTPGTTPAGGANKVLSNLKMNLKAMGDPNEEYTAEGHIFPYDSSSSVESGGGTYETPFTAGEFTYIGDSVFHAAAPSGAGAAKTRIYTPPVNSEPTRKSLYVERGVASAVKKFNMVVPNSLNFTLKKQGQRPVITGDVLSKKLALGTSFTASPTVIKDRPLPITAFDIYWATAWADLGVSDTLLATMWKIEFGYGPVVAPSYFLGSAESSIDSFGPVIPANSAGITLPQDVSGTDFADILTLSKKRNSTPIFLRIIATGPEIETGINETWEAKMCLRARNVPDEEDIDAVWLGNKWTCGLFIDEASTKALEIKTISDLAAA
jgi:hypothetical protein